MYSFEKLMYLAIFAGVFVLSLSADILLHKRKGSTSIANALLWTVVWIVVAVLFGGVTWWFLGKDAASLYLTGWVLEKTLAIDNLFAFMAVFASFGLMGRENEHLQHRILHWGIIGAIVLRALFLTVMGGLLNLPSPYNEAIIIVFALLVAGTAVLMLRSGDESSIDYSNHWSVRMVKRWLPVEPTLAGGKFFVKKTVDGRVVRYITIPFLCLVCVEAVDVGFAFDSMPAIAAVVKDPIIMLTATMMAVAGLRALYFALLGATNLLCHLEKAVIGLLFYISAKLILGALNVVHISNLVNLGVAVGFIAIGVLASFMFPEKHKEKEATA